MKILAIRGCNLASLAGEFEIDLAHGPLGGTGVFAIVGNTGAGKTTLLDALCVALFDRTPRLTNHSTVKVGRGADERALLGAQDVRTLLRRGAAAGWAEVDFESGDARQYRARWSVRRARGQSDGTLQDEQLSLTAIAGGERFGGTKTETLKAIHARLGLSFDQFRRSALLAQGEFAAFLRADGKDRSELLERMTGTQIYSQLSIAAHLKAALAEQRLRDGGAAAQAIAVLDEDAAQAARLALADAVAEAAGARRRHAAAVEAARWNAEAARRARALAGAEAEHAAARAAVGAAEADRAELALRRRAELLRPVWDEAARLERAVEQAGAEMAAAADAATRAAGELAAIGERRAQIAALHAPVRAARIGAGIVERELAGRAETAGAGGVVDDAASGRLAPDDADRGRSRSAEARRAPSAGLPRGAQLEQLVRTAADDAVWLGSRSALGPEIAVWQELDGRFAAHAAIGEAIAALDRTLADHTELGARLAQPRAQLAGELREATQRHDEAKRTAASYAHKRGLTLTAARKAEDEARTRLGEAERLVAIARDARAAAAMRDEADRALAAIEAAAAGDAARHGEVSDARRIAQAVRAEQARAVEDLRRAADYTHARAELVDGEPCPLCGASEHPWEGRGALDGAIAAAEARLAATQAEIDALAAQLAQLALREQHRGHERVRLVAQRAAGVAAAAAGQATWRSLLVALGELLLVGEPAAAAAEDLAADRQALARKALEDARATRSQTEAATKAAQDAQAEVQLRQVAVDQLAQKLAELDRRRAEIEARLGQRRGERASKLEHHATLARELAVAMQRWLAALPADASGRAGPVPPGVPVDATASAVAEVAAAGATAATAAGATAATAAGAAAASAVGAAAGAAGAVDAALAVALVARLQASVPARTVGAPLSGSPLAIVRIAMAAVAAVWRDRAARIAHADGVLTAAASAIEHEARDIDRAAAEHSTRRSDAERRRDELVRAYAAAAARLAAACHDAGFAADEPTGSERGAETAVDEVAGASSSLQAREQILASRDRPRGAGTSGAAGSRVAAAGAAAGGAAAGDGLRATRSVRATYSVLARLLAGDPARVDVLAERLAALDRAADRARAVVAEREHQVAEHAQARPAVDPESERGQIGLDDATRDPAPAAGSVQPAVISRPGTSAGADPSSASLAVECDAARVEALAAAVAAADRRAAQLGAALEADAEARARRAEALAALAAEEAGAEVDRILGDVIGSHDGKLFRSFAQSLTLDSLLAVANAHLEELAPRYQLERVPRHDLELQVIDRDLGSEVRSVQSLSGGESFLVSLALALGLSSMSAHDVRVRTLLIDEGFGTLDPATLDSALSVLDALQATGRQVGVISHVPALVERVGAHVRVVQRGGGRSEVIVA